MFRFCAPHRAVVAAAVLIGVAGTACAHVIARPNAGTAGTDQGHGYQQDAYFASPAPGGYAAEYQQPQGHVPAGQADQAQPGYWEREQPPRNQNPRSPAGVRCSRRNSWWPQ